MSDAPISLQLLTWNSASTLESALASVPSCKEILILDGGSTDATPDIAKRHGAIVIPQRDDGLAGPITDFAAVRNRGLTRATQPWILCLDSDESLSPALRDEIASIASTESPPAAYLVPRRYVLPDGTRIEHATTYPNERIYFFHRDAVDRWEKPVHERVRIKTGMPIRRLHHPTLASLPTPEEYVEKNRRYLALEIERTAGEGWSGWCRRLIRSIRTQITSTIRLAWIWLIPRTGTRLPIRHEFARWGYRWRLVLNTCPLFRRSA